MTAKYDTIGINYANLRKPDPRIAQQIEDALGDAETVLNVGAGAGNYEPIGRALTAIEPSAEMIAQRLPSDAVVMQGRAEQLPFDDDSFEASMAVLTIHHWTDKARGIAEMRRVTTGPIVFLTYDPAVLDFWLLEYLPALITLDEGQMPSMDNFRQWLGDVKISPVLVPHDCTDGFLAAYWRRPAAYLDERVRAAMSSFWALGDVSAELSKLEADLANGSWQARYGHLMKQDMLDCGYRLVVSE